MMLEGMSYTALAGQIVSLIAAAMVLVVNCITIYRLAKMKRRYPEAFEKAKEPGT
jgi:sugar (pentulose or hexulose) kinase